MPSHFDDRPDADPSVHDALALVQQTRARMVARAATPWWYPVSYGLGVGGTAAAFALPSWAIPIGQAVSLVLLLTGYVVWQRQTGLRVSGWRAGRTRTIALWLGLAIGGGILLAAQWRIRGHTPWGPLLVGVLLGASAAVASRAWDRAWRDEIATDEVP